MAEIIATEFVIRHRPMICGSAEAESRRYLKVEGKSGTTWLVADQPNAADNVYCDQHDPKSDGFGGRTLTFPLVDGGEYSCRGPWHANSNALFADTGMDVRDKCFTFVVIARRRSYKSKPSYETVLEDVLYQDLDWQIGHFSRWKEIARQLWEQGEHELVYYSQSSGGSSNGSIRAKDIGVEE